MMFVSTLHPWTQPISKIIVLTTWAVLSAWGSPLAAQDSLNLLRIPNASDLHRVERAPSGDLWVLSHQGELIFSSSNQGSSWESFKIKKGYFEELAFRGDEIWIGGAEGRIYASTNGGKRWKSHSLDKDYNVGQLLFFGDDVLATAFSTETKKGAVFSLAPDTEWAKVFSIPGIIFTDALHHTPTSFLAGSRGILMSTNGGRAWSSVTKPTKHLVRDIQPDPCGDLHAVGHEGTRYRSKDDGQSWTVQDPFTTTLLRSIAWSSCSEGWIAGDPDASGHSLWQTQDGGETWTAIPTVNQSVHDLLFVGDTLYGVGENGLFFRQKIPPK